jgi:Penicillin V acylase and related amidases
VKITIRILNLAYVPHSISQITAYYEKFIPFIAVGAICTLLTMSCTSNGSKATSENPSQYLTDSEKIEMVHSLRTVDGDRFLEMDYTLDYKLDDLIEFDANSYDKLIQFMTENLLDVMPDHSMAIGTASGCSAYAATDPATSEKYFGRNYDFCHVEDGTEVPITAIMVNIVPENGKKSINMVDAYWLGYHKGFYNDGQSDLSMLMGAPYTVLDGMNEDGFAMGILHLGGNPTAQVDPAKKSLWCNVLIRALLDKAGSVDEAIELAKNFNVNMVNPALGNDHFFLADAEGNYAILEYTFAEDEKKPEEATPNRMLVLDDPEHSYVTNFYVDPMLADNDVFGGKAIRGKYRYEILEGTLKLNAYKLTYEQARDLLKAVSTPSNPEENTSHTQWSALYNLSQRTMDISILQEFEKKYSFSL